MVRKHQFHHLCVHISVNRLVVRLSQSMKIIIDKNDYLYSYRPSLVKVILTCIEVKLSVFGQQNLSKLPQSAIGFLSNNCPARNKCTT